MCFVGEVVDKAHETILLTLGQAAARPWVEQCDLPGSLRPRELEKLIELLVRQRLTFEDLVELRLDSTDLAGVRAAAGMHASERESGDNAQCGGQKGRSGARTGVRMHWTRVLLDWQPMDEMSGPFTCMLMRG